MHNLSIIPLLVTVIFSTPLPDYRNKMSVKPSTAIILSIKKQRNPFYMIYIGYYTLQPIKSYLHLTYIIPYYYIAFTSSRTS